MAIRHVKKACDENSDYVQHAIQSSEIKQGPGLCCVASKTGSAHRTAVSRSHSLFVSVHFPDTPSQSQLGLQLCMDAEWPCQWHFISSHSKNSLIFWYVFRRGRLQVAWNGKAEAQHHFQRLEDLSPEHWVGPPGKKYWSQGLRGHCGLLPGKSRLARGGEQKLLPFPRKTYEQAEELSSPFQLEQAR